MTTQMRGRKKKPEVFTVTRLEVDNLRNRLEGARKSANYNERQFVDVPVALADGLITLAYDALGGTSAVRITEHSP